jgi:hypothetical protein
VNTHQLVGVWAAHGDPDNPTWRFATGYVVAPDRVLTALHLLQQGWIRIEIGPFGVAKDATPAAVLWPRLQIGQGYEESADSIDAVVLEWVSNTLGAINPVRYMEECPEGFIIWFANCYPALVRENPSPPDSYCDVRGDLNPPRKDAPNFPVEATNIKGVTGASWMGASGGPIFNEDGSRLIGILKKFHPGNSHSSGSNGSDPLERLIVVAAWHIWRDSGFREAVDPPDGKFKEGDQRGLGRLRRSLELELGTILDDVVLRKLEVSFELQAGSLPKAWATLCDQLVSNVKQGVRKLAIVSRSCRNDHIRRTLEQAENELLPWMFSEDERKRFWKEIRRTGHVLVENAVTSHASAELRMAAIDGRPARFRTASSGSGAEDVPGDDGHAVTCVVPGDMNSGAVAVRMLCEIAVAAPGVGFGRLPFAREAIDEVIRGTVAPSVLSGAANRLKDIGGVLEKALTMREGTQYCVVHPSSLGISRKLLIEAVAEIRKVTPSLEFLELCNKSTVAEHETPMLAILSDRLRASSSRSVT